MRGAWRGTVMAVAAAMALDTAGAAQTSNTDIERQLSGRFGFTPAEIAQVRSGQAVTKLLPSKEAGEAGVLGAVRINGNPERLIVWLKDVASFRKAAELGVSRRLSDPPAIGDFADLSLDAGELSALRDCRPGNCDLRIGDTAMQRFQTEVDWTAADAGRRANLLTRQLLLGHAQAYLQGGDAALGAYHNERTPRVLGDEFRHLLSQATALHDIAPPLAAYLAGFPSAPLPGSEQFLYWAKGGVGPDASVTLHQLVIYRAPGGETFVADKQLYSSRYVDAAITVISIAPSADSTGFYALIGARARSTMLKGFAARVLRAGVEKTARETTSMYLDWIRASLAN